MAFAANNQFLASDFIALKARVKAECLRRKYIGSVASYGGAAYDYAVIPAAGNVVLPEHLNKLTEPLNAIAPTGYNTAQKGAAIPNLTALNAFLTASESYSLTSPVTNCKSTCTGLCVGACSTTCTGCTSCTSCTGCTSCSGSCSGTCSGCSGSCSSACSRACHLTCITTCRSGCGAGCKGGCYDSCAVGCTGWCSGCSSCTGTCSSTCRGSDTR